MAKILIVDDEPSIRATLKIVLETEGYDVQEVSSADDAWNKLKMAKPDLMLLDVMMPGMKPVDLIKRVKDNTMYSDLKIIMVTAVGGAEKIEGTLGTIAKPFQNEELLAEVKKALDE
jgi:DNA-binding response OmpR family regulator